MTHQDEMTASRTDGVDAVNRVLGRLASYTPKAPNNAVLQRELRRFFGANPRVNDIIALLTRTKNDLQNATLQEYDGVTHTAAPDRRLADAAVRNGVPALAQPGHDMILCFPTFFTDGTALQPGRMIHEATHLAGLRGHPQTTPHGDPFAYQGFVCSLEGLSAPVPFRRYPP